MEKIYGYKESDVIGFSEFLKTKRNESLSKIFENYAKQNGKAKGTVRNLYYALAKRSAFDKEFCDKYLGGKAIAVERIVEFDVYEEKELIEKILIAVSGGKSVRGAIIEITGGDAKKALRYQNKFRNVLKTKPELIAKITKELKEGGKIGNEGFSLKRDGAAVSDVRIKNLKKEINDMVGRIAFKIRKENEYLKDRVMRLERENLKLRNLLYGGEKSFDVRKFFTNGGGREILS